MGAFDSEDTDTTDVNKTEDMPSEEEVQAVLKQAGLPPDLAAALRTVVPWLRKQAGADENKAVKDQLMRVATFLGNVMGGKYPSPAGKADDKDDEKAKADAKKALEEVEKARRVTTARIAAIRDIHAKASELLKDLDPDALKDKDDDDSTLEQKLAKSIMSALETDLLARADALVNKATGKKGKDGKAVGEGDEEDEDEEKSSKIKKVVESALEPISKRLGALEGGSKAGDNDTTEVEKSDGDGFWSGVL